MRKKTAILGALLIAAAAYLYVTPSLTSPLAASLGQTGTDTVFDKNSVIPVSPQNSSFYEANLTKGESLVVTLMTNPGNIDVLLMNQGNFSLWSSGSAVSYSTYPESALHVSNYSFTFTNDERSQDFFVVFVSHSAAEPTEVLLHAKGTRPSQASLLVFPVVIGLVGFAVLGFAARGGGRRGARRVGGEGGSSRPAEAAQAHVQVNACRHCGAALTPGSQFCPVCSKSQL